MGPLCHAWLFFPSYLSLHKAGASSSAGDQLLILVPAWRAGPSPIPPTWVDPISLRLQAPSCFSVGNRRKCCRRIYQQASFPRPKGLLFLICLGFSFFGFLLYDSSHKVETEKTWREWTTEVWSISVKVESAKDCKMKVVNIWFGFEASTVCMNGDDLQH